MFASSSHRGPLGPVVIPFDGSSAGVTAVRFAIRLASLADSRVLVLWPRGLRTTSWSPDADAQLCDPRPFEEQARSMGVHLEHELVPEVTATRLIDHAVACQAFSLVAAFHPQRGVDHGLDQRAAERVMEMAPAPTVWIPREYTLGDPQLPFRHILVPLDGSPFSESALSPAVQLAGASGSEVLLMQVVPPAAGAARYSLTYAPLMRIAARHYLQIIAARTARDKVCLHTITCSGPVAQTIAAVAERCRADLIVMGTRASRGFARLITGSHTLRTLALTSVPLMVVGPGAAAQLPARAAAGEETTSRTELVGHSPNPAQ